MLRWLLALAALALATFTAVQNHKLTRRIEVAAEPAPSAPVAHEIVEREWWQPLWIPRTLVCVWADGDVEARCAFAPRTEYPSARACYQTEYGAVRMLELEARARSLNIRTRVDCVQEFDV